MSEAAGLIVGILQTQKSDIRPLARDRSGELSRIDTIARIEWNGHRSPKPKDRYRHVALRKALLR
ncbi:hypothetical protein ACQR1W_21235 [Bradyrhizobium sp. HKCCYLS1011]|uniref:hypothetical protein n=1 Tax=Bradyrhizobium sp. HKCCYLS1011 TaxID=3420733 RepID=UPI003EBC2545